MKSYIEATEIFHRLEYTRTKEDNNNTPRTDFDLLSHLVVSYSIWFSFIKLYIFTPPIDNNKKPNFFILFFNIKNYGAWRDDVMR